MCEINFEKDLTQEMRREEKEKIDNAEILNCLKIALKQNAIAMKVVKDWRRHALSTRENYVSDITEVRLDLSEHDKKKDTEIEKCKKAFEAAKVEKDKAVCKYQNEIDALKRKIQELEETQEDLPYEPIKIAEYLMDRTIEVKNTFPALQGGETSCVVVHDVSELRQIAEHLLVYCNHAEVE